MCEGERVCVRERGREGQCVCVREGESVICEGRECVRQRERGTVCAWVCVCVCV